MTQRDGTGREVGGRFRMGNTRTPVSDSCWCRHYFANKGPFSQGYGFSSSHVWMWSWTIKKAEHQRIDAFELWCWRRLLRAPWIARRSTQSILKEISPGISLEGMMLKLKLQYFGHLMQRVDSLEKTLMLGGIGGTRRRERQRMRWLDGITDLMDMRVGLWRKLSTKELMLLNCDVGEDSWESHGLQEDPTSPF